MSPRFAPAILGSLALIPVAGCAGAASAPASAAPAASAPVVHAPDPTPLPVVSPVATPSATPVIGDTGDVDGPGTGPELVIEPLDDDTIQATIQDPDAKAWRLTIAGAGELGDERWEIRVETGDVSPIVTAVEIRDGQEADVLDLTGFVDGTAAAGGCHSVLPVCIDSDGFKLPEDGNGLFSVRLDLPEAQVPLVIHGGTAAWDGEPFVLGDWHDTEAFPWGEG